MADKAKAATPRNQKNEEPATNLAAFAFEFHSKIPQSCPPKGAKNADGFTIYRLARKENLSDRDLSTHHEREPDKYTACIAFGYSVYVSIPDVCAASSRIPGLGKYVYQCQAGPHHGKLEHTPTGNSDAHHTFWVDQRIDRSQLFELVSHVDKL